MQSSEQTITVAGKLGSEPEVLMNMYKELIENEDPKLKVQTKPNFGNTNFFYLKPLRINKLIFIQSLQELF